MDAHLGFERPTYPGDTVMTELRRATSLRWCTLPLGAARGATGTPGTPGASGTWSTKVGLLRSVGWGLAPTYRPSIDPRHTGRGESGRRGRADAVHAAQRAIRAGLVDGDVLYLDVAGTGALAPTAVTYAAAWFEGLAELTTFQPAVRCAHDPVATQLRATHPDLLVWVVNTGGRRAADAFAPGGGLAAPDLARCGYPEALAWQFLRACVTVPFLTTDGTAATLGPLALAVALVGDPSRPGGAPPVGKDRRERRVPEVLAS